MPELVSLIYTNVDPYVCSGVAVAVCSAANVGLTNGAIGKSSVTTLVQFDTVVPLPPTLYLLGTAIGLVGTRVAGKRREQRNTAA